MSDISQQLQDLVHAHAAATVQIAADATFELMQVTVEQNHYVTGTLYDSLYEDDMEDDGEILSVTVGSDAETAGWTDTGTDPHEILPGGDYPLHWIGDDGTDVFRRSVWHPGYTGDLWFTNLTTEDAWEQQLQIAWDLVDDAD